MFQANLVPGQGFRQFTVWEKQGNVTDTGRAQKGIWAESEKRFYGILTNANQREADQWKQNGHPITHKIISYGAMTQAKPTDYIKLDDGRKFYVQGIKNHGGLNISISYYVEERMDLK
jgi:hypothetical protein